MSNDIILSTGKLSDLIQSFAAVVDEKFKAFKQQEIDEKLVSPAKACQLFDPPISKPTLQSWTDQGLFKDYRMGRRVFYKYSEIIEAAKHLKRYQAHKMKQRPSN